MHLNLDKNSHIFFFIWSLKIHHYLPRPLLPWRAFVVFVDFVNVFVWSNEFRQRVIKISVLIIVAFTFSLLVEPWLLLLCFRCFQAFRLLSHISNILQTGGFTEEREVVKLPFFSFSIYIVFYIYIGTIGRDFGAYPIPSSQKEILSFLWEVLGVLGPIYIYTVYIYGIISTAFIQ